VAQQQDTSHHHVLLPGAGVAVAWAGAPPPPPPPPSLLLLLLPLLLLPLLLLLQTAPLPPAVRRQGRRDHDHAPLRVRFRLACLRFLHLAIPPLPPSASGFASTFSFAFFCLDFLLLSSFIGWLYAVCRRV
jgi:hypothetical protein